MSEFQLKHLKKGSNEALLTTMADAKRRIAEKTGAQGQKICKDYLTMINVAIFFIKDYVAKDVIDNELMKLQTYGFTNQWFKYFVNHEYQNSDKYFEQTSSDPTVLQFVHLEGVFIIGLVGIIISCIAFGFELFFGEMKIKTVGKL